VTGTIDGRRIVIGNQLMMQAGAIDIAALEQTAEESRNEGATAIFIAIDGKPSGVIVIADPKRPRPLALFGLSAKRESASSC